MLSEGYRKLLAAGELSEEEQRTAIETVARANPMLLPELCQLLANQKRQLRGELEAAREAFRQARDAIARLREPPWYPAGVLRVCSGGRLEVLAGGRRQVVTVAPEVDTARLRPGEEVLLSHDQARVIAPSDAPRTTGLVGTVAEAGDGRVLLCGGGDEEMVAGCAPELAAALRPGDRVLYRREGQWVLVLERLAEGGEGPYVLAEPPATTFADIGGLDEVVAEMRRDLDLYLLRPDLAAAYRLRPLRGITLVGPPGSGKTLIAKAVANHLHRVRPGTRFMYVPPGSLRGIYYGQTEHRIRALFDAARGAPGLAVIFFDELDNFGARSGGPGQDIDGRVMGTLLAEIDGLDPAAAILCVGATNRLDLCDTALVRPGRLGDRIYPIPRPGRAAARDIFARYLEPGLPYHPAGADGAAALIEAAVAYLYAPRGGAAPLATVTLASGERREIEPREVVSGALIASAVERAKRGAAARHGREGGGLTVEDLLAAVDQALAAEADKLRAPHAARRILAFPEASDIVRVEVPRRPRARRHRYVRAV